MIGRMISHYKILDKLGAGGMGVVYKAEDTKLRRTVALKFLPRELTSDGDAKARFVREAQTASALQHNNICAIHEIDETEDGRMFLSMDCYRGETLKDRIIKGPLPLEEVIEIATQVADGLAEAHEAGVVHRDVKPANIMVTDKGVVKILDFGLAKLAGAAKVTRTGMTLGTVAYMSPEQARGEEADARSDIWSLGVVSYELLTGRLPFKGDHDAAVVYGIMHTDPEPLASSRDDVPSKLEGVVSKCLEKKAGDRYQSAAGLKVALRECLVQETRKDRPSIAVLPFINMSGAKEDDYLCEGLAEEIISALTRIPGLRVIARTSSFAVARTGLDVREAGRRLDVGSILEGSVRREGRRVRVTAQLVSTIDNSHLWSERYDRELTDVLVLEDEIAAAISARLRVELASAERELKRPVVDVQSHTAYLEGRYFFARGTLEGMAKAKSCYERAIERDPNSALAYDSLAELYWYFGFFGAMPPREAFSLSLWNALRALELDDTLAETHALLGMLRKELDYNWPEVDREHRKALELNRDSPLVRLRYAISGLLPRGRIDEAVAEMEYVVRNDPLSIFVRWWAGVMTCLSGRPAKMVEEGRHMLALDPTHFFGHFIFGMGLDGTGERAEALVALEKAHELSGGIPFTLGFLAYANGRAGRREDARKLLEQAGQAAAAGYFPPSVFALGYAGLEDWDAVLEWMGKAIDSRDPLAMPIKTYPFLDPLRSDPRYRALLKKMNLE